jgi:hypothetical protein
MTTKSINKIIIAGMMACGGVATLTTSCSDMLESDSERQLFEPDINQKTDSIYYALGILQGVQQLADQYMFIGEMRGDLVDVTEYTSNDLRQLAQFSQADNKYNAANVYYRVINNCNYYIAHRDTTLRTGATYIAMNEYVAVKAIRAWAYMQLARVYGKVPFYTEPLTQISQINKNTFPELDMDGLAAQLLPDLEQYTGYGMPHYGNAPSGITTSMLFMPVDVVMGDMYLETNQYDKAARHYITYLTEVLPANRANTAYMQSVTFSGRRSMSMMEMLPGDFGASFNYLTTSWSEIFSGGSDVITYVPMAPNNRAGVTSQIPLAYGYDFYSNSRGYVDEIQIVPSSVYNQLSESQDYYYRSALSTATKTILNSVKLGDMRTTAITRERDNAETAETKTWITKNTSSQVLLYRVSGVWLRLAEAFNRLGYYDLAFAILKDGMSRHLIQPAGAGGPYYISDESKQALQTTYPLLSEANISRFSESVNCIGVHMHGAGATCDYTGTVYSPGLSPYQLDTIVGMKMAEVAQQYAVTVGTTKQDTINAVEDLLCDEYALECAFEGGRWYDLMRLARHKNSDSTYGSNFGGQWLARKLAFKNPMVSLEDKNNWYLPFK